MSKEELNAHLKPCLKRVDTDGDVIVIPPGVTCFGRGPFLKVRLHQKIPMVCSVAGH